MQRSSKPQSHRSRSERVPNQETASSSTVTLQRMTRRCRTVGQSDEIAEPRSKSFCTIADPVKNLQGQARVTVHYRHRCKIQDESGDEAVPGAHQKKDRGGEVGERRTVMNAGGNYKHFGHGVGMLSDGRHHCGRTLVLLPTVQRGELLMCCPSLRTCTHTGQTTPRPRLKRSSEAMEKYCRSNVSSGHRQCLTTCLVTVVHYQRISVRSSLAAIDEYRPP